MKTFEHLFAGPPWSGFYSDLPGGARIFIHSTWPTSYAIIISGYLYRQVFPLQERKKDKLLLRLRITKGNGVFFWVKKGRPSNLVHSKPN
jgi:hypothetical protein